MRLWQKSFLSLLITGLLPLHSVAAPLAICTIADQTVATASLAKIPDDTLCKAIFWNAYAGCINQGYSSIFCRPGIILIGNQVWKHISTVDNTQAALNHLCMRGNSTDPSCTIDLAYFTSGATQTSYTTQDQGVSYTIYPMSCPKKDIVTLRPCDY